MAGRMTLSRIEHHCYVYFSFAGIIVILVNVIVIRSTQLNKVIVNVILISAIQLNVVVPICSLPRVNFYEDILLNYRDGFTKLVTNFLRSS